jgi:hypothetical protein
VELYRFFSQALAVLATITLAVPLSVPLAALAYKVRLGPKPVPFEPKPFWLRSAGAALGLALFTGVALGLERVLVAGVEFPAGPVHLVLFMAYLPAGVWLMFWMYALDDLIEGLGVFLIYLLVPGLPLFLLGLLLDRWFVLTPWLLPSSPA